MQTNQRRVRESLQGCSLRPQIMHIKVQLIALIHMAMRLLGFAVDVVDRMLMERVRVVTVQDVIQTGRMRQPKDSVTMTRLV